VGGRWSVVGGRWSVVGGRWSVVGGRWSVVGDFRRRAAQRPSPAGRRHRAGIDRPPKITAPA
ncbi:hypothetical protein E4L69_36520, partial [Burkholderia pseudomallei]|nr:hypothetical protein [Burkholderia pseudomallei]